ncbi:hypothetical protein RND81_09G177900 [Saponaria officinalis]|uniref:non-specific serine/threonine protein kinase n=1 Tax=Saponaria officinalis TaxID=3572 RepID=A0AAW1IN76_SAPOF
MTFGIIICATFLFSCLHLSLAGNNDTDGMALLDIKAKITHDPLRVMSSWNDTLHFCEWHGVTCGGGRQRVTSLNLQSAQLIGTLSPYLGNLSFLTELYLQNNSFTGTVPSEIGRLKRLESFWLFNNSFSGEIPSNISSCSNLIELNLSNNKLVGIIPPQLAFLLHLQVLDLAINNLTGNIPTSLGNLSSLNNLIMGRNNLVGSIPDSLGNLKELRNFNFAMNKLSGIVPPSIFNISSLIHFDVAYNAMEGSLPSDLGTSLPHIQYFSIYSNQFTGTIPASISNSSNLRVLQFTLNNLHGQVPSLHKLDRLTSFTVYSNFLGTGSLGDLDFVSSLANATMLSNFDISVNNFKGTFPQIVCNFTMLSYLGLEYNHIDGHIPVCIERLSNLHFFTATSNQLSGVIPAGIGKLLNLVGLYLASNKLSGYMPSTVGNLTMLTYLDVSGNHLDGRIPSGLGNCGNLLALDFSDNHFSGSIPSELLSLSTLSILLNLSSNYLNGSLSAEVEKLYQLDVLDISGNMLSGEIPSTLSACVGLEALIMGRNFFQGTIPEALKTLKGLSVLDLSRNNLSGKIPTFLASFQLQTLNLSYNNLEGELPIGGVFNNVSGAILVGNNRLCGGIPELKLPKCSFSGRIQKRSRRKMKLVISLLSGCVGVTFLVAVLLLYFFWHRKKNNPTASADFENLPNLSYHSLLKATNGFSAGNMLGSGAFGVVYKGSIDQDKTLVAIKIFKLNHRGASQSFMAECGVLRNIRHRNLVKVITACSSVDHQGSDFKALVYEYMVNGSLDDWLHPKEKTGLEGNQNLTTELDFRQRLDIAVEVALALEYLHHYSSVSIVHCDLKPSNVLLDDEMVAHVSDFGLAKFLSEGTISSTADQSSLFGVRGTIGYTPPEYGLGNKLSTNGDVYSFGILVLEMFTGKRPTDNMFHEGVSLHDYVKAAVPEQATEILDPVLLDEIVRKETNCNIMTDATIAILDIALLCSAQLPTDRLHMSDVAAKLASVRNGLFGT